MMEQNKTKLQRANLPESLSKLWARLQAVSDSQEAAEATLTAVMDAMEAKRGFLGLISLEYKGQAGDESRLSEMFGVQARRDFSLEDLDRADMTAEGSAIREALRGPGNTPASALAPGKPAVCAAFKAGGQTIGVCYLEREETGLTFSADDTQLAQLLAGFGALDVRSLMQDEEIRRINQAKAKFVSVVTHELRIPMTSIKGYTDLMRKGMVGPVNDMQTEFLNIIRNNVERMSALVSDLSDISHAESGRLKLQLAPISLPAVITESLNNLRPKIDEKGQTLECDIPEDLPNVNADQSRVVQVMNNLLSNATKYTPQGGKVCVRAYQQGDCVRVEVSDNGIGISVEDQGRLFSQFFRSDDPAVREEPGWGLGLSIAKMLVDLMDGEIGATSALKEGSTFWFTLPVVKQAG
ncbi:MAG: sensor histidine kinase [Chloroflexota bacterium]|nr:MAG: sensor histidine kinase [Chloroflexota bacterium]